MRRRRKLPAFKTRSAEARFWDSHSMLDYLPDLDRVDEVLALAPALAEKIRERAKTRAVSLRLPQWEIDAAKKVARRKGVGYQVLIKAWIAQSIRREARSAAKAL